MGWSAVECVVDWSGEAFIERFVKWSELCCGLCSEVECVLQRSGA